MNGGIYYIKKGSIADSVFRDTEDVIREYSNIDFQYFKTPMDEPVMAMAMVLNECIPCEKSFEMVILPAYSKRLTADYKGNLFSDHDAFDTRLIHFSTPRTRLFLYNYLDAVNKQKHMSKTDYYRMYISYLPIGFWFSVKHKCGAVLRMFGLGRGVDWMKKLVRHSGKYDKGIR